MEPARLSLSKIEQRELEQKRELGQGSRWDMSRSRQQDNARKDTTRGRGRGGIGGVREDRNREDHKTRDDHRQKRQQQNHHQPRIKLDDNNQCWFCLATPEVEKHLIIAIGDYCYLTLAKGGLTEEHFLLIPIDHIRAINDTEASNSSKELLKELEKFKDSIVKYFGKKGQGVVFFERNFRSVHWQLQAVPIGLGILDTVEENIKSISSQHFKGAEYLDIPANCSLCDIVPPGVPYFFWQIEPIGSRFVTQIQVKGAFFPIQLGRLVLADTKVLNCSEKADWKACTKTQTEYEDLVKQIRELYKEFDFT